MKLSLVFLLLVGCSSSEAPVDCGTLAEEINSAALRLGLSRVGVCTNPNPELQRQIATKCSDIHDRCGE
jgi:hypothetical protein